jgi:hypothetical protein
MFLIHKRVIAHLTLRKSRSEEYCLLDTTKCSPLKLNHEDGGDMSTYFQRSTRRYITEDTRTTTGVRTLTLTFDSGQWKLNRGSTSIECWVAGYEQYGPV